MAATTASAPSHRPGPGQRTLSGGSSTYSDHSSGSGSPSGSSPRSRNASGSALQLPSASVDSASSSTSLSTSPQHDPNRRPSASILDNAHEAPPRKSIKPARTTRSAIKAAFIPAQPGKQMKSDGKPIGKTFERKVPLPNDCKIQGGQVLEHDPRGQDASAGDGIVLTTPTSEEPPSLNPADSRGARRDTVSSVASTSDFGSSYGAASSSSQQSDATGRSSPATTSSSTQDESLDGKRQSHVHHGRHRTDTMSTDASSASGHSTSIRFAPLPVSGRLKRANSITIGVAARSQLLHSQGSGRNTGFPVQHQQHQQQYNAHPQYRQTPHRQQYQQQWQRPDDVIDLGEEISKRAKKAWTKMRGGKASPPAAATTAQEKAQPQLPETAQQQEQQQYTPNGHVNANHILDSGQNTPRRPSSPVSSMAKMSLDDRAAKPSLDTIRGASRKDDATAAAEPSGTRTPRGSQDEHTPHLSRRLSTGAFLGGASIRGMQEERRREMVGPGEDDDIYDGDVDGDAAQEQQPQKANKRRVIEPQHNPEEEEFGDARSDVGGMDVDDDDEDNDDEDDEEMAEAERLAEQSMQRGRENKAAGVEIVH